MDQLLDLLLYSSHENSDLIAQAETFPEFLSKLRRQVHDEAATIRPTPSTIDLVPKALKNEIEVDLGVFKSFAARDLALLVAKLRGCKDEGFEPRQHA